MYAINLKKTFLYNLLRSSYLIILYPFRSYLKNKISQKDQARQDFKNYQFKSFTSVLYWIGYMHYISLFKNINNSRKSKYFFDHSLNKDGYARLNDLNDQLLNDLINFYLEKKSFNGNLEEYFDELSTKGDVRPKGLNMLEHPNILKRILKDTLILPIVKEHLGINFDQMHLYGKFDTLIKLDSERLKKSHDDALVFHRDYDSHKAVKVFFYLNEINEGCGHHEIFLKSHRVLPMRLRPIRRYKKDEIEQYIDPSSLKKVTGKPGFGFIENTTCFHRGTVPTEGNRMIITLSFNDSKTIKRLQRDIINGETFYAPLNEFL